MVCESLVDNQKKSYPGHAFGHRKPEIVFPLGIQLKGKQGPKELEFSEQIFAIIWARRKRKAQQRSC